MKTSLLSPMVKFLAACSVVCAGLSGAHAAPFDAQVSVLPVAQALRTGEGQRKAIYAVNHASDSAATQVVTVNAAWLQANPQAAEALVREFAKADGAIPDARLAARVKAALQLADGASLNALFAPEVARRALAGK